jgi:hypothetical protein
MIADDFGDQGKPKSRPRGFRGDEWIEQMRNEIGRHTGAVIFDRNLERQAHAGLTPRHRKTHARPERGGQRDLAVRPLLADRLGGVLHQIEKGLNEVVAASRHRRQGRIVVLDDLHAAGEAGARDLFHMVEDVVNVDRLTLHRPLVTENLHSVDELADAV